MADSAQKNLQMRVNPISMTARIAVYLMAQAGIADARKICAGLGIDAAGDVPGMVKLEGDALFGNAVVVEAKYRTMCKLIKESGMGICVDLPCGYTPKAIHLTESGMRFVGMDLPIVADEANEAILPLVSNRAMASFHGVDATNYESLRAALEDVDEPVCISTEGMMMYFTENEVSVVVDNISRLLAEHGGCWITPDPEFTQQFLLTFTSLFGEEAARGLVSSGSTAKGNSDVSSLMNCLIVDPFNMQASTERAISFLASHHLKVERISLGQNLPPLHCYERFAAEQVEAFKKAMDNCFYWVMTREQLDSQTVTEVRGFRCVCQRWGNELRYTLAGRLDTISSPELLDSFEGACKTADVHSVQVDCRDLDYISSAGIRVLLLMHKACEGRVTLSNVAGAVQEVLDQTGLSQLF